MKPKPHMPHRSPIFEDYGTPVHDLDMANRLRRRNAAKMFFYRVVEIIAVLALAALIIWLAFAPIPSYGQDFSGPFGTPAKLLPSYTLDAAGSNQWSLAQDVIVQPDSAKVPTVPEPSTVALSALGLAAVVARCRS